MAAEAAEGRAMNIGIVGFGVVGKALGKLFGFESVNGHPRVYDKFLTGLSGPANKAAIQECDLVFISVPTPEGPGGGCDISAVEEVVRWVEPPMCVKSTVPPGTVDGLVRETGKQIAFSPEYLGETPWHCMREIENLSFVIVGGHAPIRDLVVRAYQTVFGPTVRYYLTNARTAELCKYMENTFLATKVAFVNQFYDLAKAIGVDFNELRELWLADERIGRSHSMVTQERGFRGRCFPKDIAAFTYWAKSLGGAPLLEAVDRYNDALCRRADELRSRDAPRAASPSEIVRAPANPCN